MDCGRFILPISPYFCCIAPVLLLMTPTLLLMTSALFLVTSVYPFDPVCSCLPPARDMHVLAQHLHDAKSTQDPQEIQQKIQQIYAIPHSLIGNINNHPIARPLGYECH